MKWIEEEKVIHPQKNNNWKLNPEDWRTQGSKKDYELMYK